MTDEREGGASANGTTTNTEGPVEVFISYSSHDRDKVEKLAYALSKSGFNVWWDRALLPGDSYEGSIEVALKQAKAVIVCWTQNSIASDWVRSEADDARVNGKLLPIFMEEVPLPKPFDRIHTENLIGWRGNRDHHAYQELEEAVRARVEGRAAKAIPWRRKWITRGALVSVLAMVGVAAANVSLIKDLFFPAQTLTADQVEQIVAAALAQAGKQGVDMDERSQDNLRETLAGIMKSTDAEKADAREALRSGRVKDAADSLADVARRQAEAAGGAVTAAAESYREAGALYSATDTRAALEAYRRSLALVPTPENPDAANGLAQILERTGELEEARALYTEVLETKGQTEPIWKAKMLGNLGLMDQERGDLKGAEDKILEAMEIFKEEGDEVALAKALLNLGQIAQTDERWEVADDYTQRGLSLSKRIGLPRGEATALANLGYQQMMLNDFDGARSYFDQAAAVMETNGLKTELGLIYINLARMLNIEARYDESAEVAQKALKVAQEMDAKVVEGGAYNHLAVVAREQGNFDEAELYQIKAIKIFEELESPLKLEQQYRAYGLIAEARGDVDAAIARYQKALDVMKNVDAPTVKADALLSMARLHAKVERYEDAVGYVDQAIGYYSQRNDELGIGDSLSMLAKIRRAGGDAQGAVDAFAQAKDHYLAADRPAYAAEAMGQIGEIAFQVQDANVALNAFEEANALLPDEAALELVAFIGKGLAEARWQNGDDAGAAQMAQQTMNRMDASAVPRPEMRADLRVFMARLKRASGAEDEAQSLFTRAADLMREAGADYAVAVEQIEAERDAQPPQE